MKIKLSVLITIIIFTLSFILLIPCALFAQEEVDDEAIEEEAEEIEEIEIPESIEFDITFPEIQAKSGATFEFQTDILYIGTEEYTFDLLAEAPEGWYAAVTQAYAATEISAIKLKPGKNESIKIYAIPLVQMDPGEYDIVVTISNEELELENSIELKAIITASYELSLTTKSGRYDTDVSSGKDNHFELKLKNSGSTSIENIKFNTDEPEGWIVELDPEEVESLEAGISEEIDLIINPPEKTIAGDYMLTVRVSSENSEDSIDIRVTVLTPTIWGWVGIGIIVVVVIGVAVIFARLGRR